MCAAWAALEQNEGNLALARSIYASGDAFESVRRPSAISLLLEWAALELAAGNATGANKLLVSASERAPRSPKPLLAIGQVQVERGEHEEARRSFAAAAELGGGKRQKPSGAREADEAGDEEVYNVWAAFEARVGDPSTRWTRGLKVVEQGQRRYPSAPSLLQTRGTLLHRAGDVDGARRAFDESIALSARAPTFVAWALLEAEAGDEARARELFERGAAADPKHTPLHRARARFEAKLGNVEAAREVLRDAVERYPSAGLWHGWGKIEERQGNLGRAAELYLKGTKAAPHPGEDSCFLWHSLGSVLLQYRRLDRALAAFDEGLKRRPSSSRLLLGAAIARSQLGRHEDARGLFLRSVQSDPAHAHAWQAWGVMESRLSNTDVARDLYRRGLRRCPDHVALWQASAKLEAAAGQGERARALFRMGAERCARSSTASLLLAWAYFEMHQGKLRDTAALLKRAATLGGHEGELHHIKALAALKGGRRDEAQREVERGLEREPTHAPLYRVLGSLQDAAGLVDEARASFREGLRLNPGYAQLYHAWARLEARVMNWAALSELNKQAKQAFPQPGDEAGTAAAGGGGVGACYAAGAGGGGSQLEQLDAVLEQAFGALGQREIRDTDSLLSNEQPEAEAET